MSLAIQQTSMQTYNNYHLPISSGSQSKLEQGLFSTVTPNPQVPGPAHNRPLLWVPIPHEAEHLPQFPQVAQGPVNTASSYKLQNLKNQIFIKLD